MLLQLFHSVMFSLLLPRVQSHFLDCANKFATVSR